jgi:hypothetical protein
MCVPALCQIVHTSQRPEIRQIAAVEMCKRCGKWWTSVDPGAQAAIKKSLLELVVSESEYAQLDYYLMAGNACGIPLRV